MATYQYRCDQDGVFEVRLPMGAATPRWTCPECGGEAARSYSAPMLALAPRELVTEIDRAEKTRDEPAVVTAVPPAHGRTRRPATASNPALQRLPRP
ncbi:FmdB family zinc ribbon protein [Amycolatopsis sp. FDAARGOS 1241]|uniref:FmdB family zinc ribbon protein n=1 Tax=Amycolatopsis sp. FDAARGOS 1241 TaxID=2778070 RepID=UPI001950D4AA|nr:zinc ribbon domain-containing protein [Amycolatopsis sp. FDAARGOS 1241]QRP47860.1 zinc ribbon domain-containing protein [Amycolatopsis sp. FDAARGOS 1241]